MMGGSFFLEVGFEATPISDYSHLGPGGAGSLLAVLGMEPGTPVSIAQGPALLRRGT